VSRHQLGQVKRGGAAVCCSLRMTASAAELLAPSICFSPPLCLVSTHSSFRPHAPTPPPASRAIQVKSLLSTLAAEQR
jgi:hypothetical protein